ncbi:MAG: SDR family oxidoreductase [Myxococcota bacterium]|nr:SDR family oxidoreductase [Myxococcota bacterium]
MNKLQVADMTGKICLVTGANSGIGLVTARELARAGAHVVMLCRSAERGEQARDAIMAATGSASVSLILGDLSSLSSVESFAAAFKERYDHLDVLVNNAGLSLPVRHRTDDGFEMMFAINHLGHFALTCRLAGELKAATRARVVNVASHGHWLGRFDVNNLHGERRFNALAQYCNTKLANILFARALAERVSHHGITSYSLHPGVIRSGFAQDESGWFGHLVKLSGPFLSSPEKGARTSLYLATAPGIESKSGHYFASSRRALCSPIAQSYGKAEALWAESERLTGLSWS